MSSTEITEVPAFGSIEPTVTDLPITQQEDGDWHAWGHVDPGAFLTAIDAVDRHWGNDGIPEEDREGYLGLVEHLWAVPHPDNPEECWLWVKQGTPHAVPITTVTL